MGFELRCPLRRDLHVMCVRFHTIILQMLYCTHIYIYHKIQCMDNGNKICRKMAREIKYRKMDKKWNIQHTNIINNNNEAWIASFFQLWLFFFFLSSLFFSVSSVFFFISNILINGDILMRFSRNLFSIKSFECSVLARWFRLEKQIWLVELFLRNETIWRTK